MQGPPGPAAARGVSVRRVASALSAGLRSRDSLLGQAVRYSILTGVSASLSLGIPVALHEIVGISPGLAVPIGFIVVFFVNFFALRTAVFVSRTIFELVLTRRKVATLSI